MMLIMQLLGGAGGQETTLRAVRGLASASLPGGKRAATSKQHLQGDTQPFLQQLSAFSSRL